MFDEDDSTQAGHHASTRGERLVPLVPETADKFDAERFGEFLADLMARGVYQRT